MSSCTHGSNKENWRWQWLPLLAFLAPIAATKDFANGDRYGRAGEHDAHPIQRMAFGSCNKHDHHNPLWDGIDEFDPDVFVWLGDAIYSDKLVPHRWFPRGIQMVEKFQSADMAEQRAIYAAQKLVPGYSRLRENSWILGVWDDHDYGLNDAGKEYKHREESRTNFLDFLDEPMDSPRRADDHPGVYASYTYGPPGQRVRIILLDTRFNRDPLLPEVHGGRRRDASSGAYARSENRHRRLLDESLDPDHAGVPSARGIGDGPGWSDIPGGDVLGEKQWQWLRRVLLEEKTEFTVIGSSIQVVENHHSILRPFFSVEGWGRFPECRERLFSLLTETGTEGALFFTGDVHFASLARLECALPYAVFDLTTSGMTHAASTHFPWPIPQAISHTLPVQFGVSPPCLDLNWASLEFHWPDPGVPEAIRDQEGKGREHNDSSQGARSKHESERLLKADKSEERGQERGPERGMHGGQDHTAEGRSKGHKATSHDDHLRSRREGEGHRGRWERSHAYGDPSHDGDYGAHISAGGGEPELDGGGGEDDEWARRHRDVPWVEVAVHAVAKWDPHQRPYVAFHRRISLDELKIPKDLEWREHCHRHGVYEQDLPWYTRYRFAMVLLSTIAAFLALVTFLIRQLLRLLYRICRFVAAGSMPMRMRRLCCQVSVRLMPAKAAPHKVE